MGDTELVKNVYYVGAMHRDRRLFDELIPLPEGTSYNSYLVIGSEKTALIDTVDPDKIEELILKLKALQIKKLDYIIVDHAEQDHSGGITRVREEYPGAKVVTNEKCKGMLKDLLLLEEDVFISVKDREVLSLGDKSLEFIFTPWVHWPETMSVYMKETGILFSCDMFGSHRAIPDIFKQEGFEGPAKRYFAEIMSPFRNNVRTNLEKLKVLDIKIIAPSHGIIFKEAKVIFAAYEDWASENVKNEVLLAYVSMHGSTKKMVEVLKAALMARGIKVHLFNLATSDLGEIAVALMDSATVIIGASTVLAGIHPLAANAAYIVNALRPKTKFASMVTSFGWGEKAVEVFKGIMTNFKGELLTPVISKGYPKATELTEINRLADEILKKHKEIGIG
ncbi:MAG: FprA family A-type flavoprotein [bacterium]